MRSDWHRYNLKRKVAELPPVSSEDYNEKVLATQAINTAAAAQAAFAKVCTICQKTYYSENAYQNHLSSRTHKLKEVTSRTASLQPTSSVTDLTADSEFRDPAAEAEFEKVVAGMKDTSIQEVPAITRRPSAPGPDDELRQEHPISPEKPHFSAIPISRCLFCNYDSPSLKLSVMHMAKIHGLFIPEQEFLVDLEGLIGYMQAKIHQNFECLYCHKLRGNAAGIQTHMRDKSHCKIAFETEAEMVEVGQFYDFSSTYSDAGESDTGMNDVTPPQNGGVKLDRGADKDDDDGWETDSSFSSLDTNDLVSVPNDDRTSSYQRLPLHKHHSNTYPRPHRTADGWHSHAHHHNNAVFYDEHEMHLPSGRVAGHRSLRRYYRQNLHNYPTAAERMERAQRLIEEGSSDAEMDDVDLPATPPRNSQLMRRGEAGMIGVTAQQRRDVKAQEHRSRTKEQRAQNRYQAKLEKQANSQKHYRVSFE